MLMKFSFFTGCPRCFNYGPFSERLDFLPSLILLFHLDLIFFCVCLELSLRVLSQNLFIVQWLFDGVVKTPVLKSGFLLSFHSVLNCASFDSWLYLKAELILSLIPLLMVSAKTPIPCFHKMKTFSPRKLFCSWWLSVDVELTIRILFQLALYPI